MLERLKNLFKQSFEFSKEVINRVHKYRTSDDWWQRDHSEIKGIVIHHPAIPIDRTKPYQTYDERLKMIMREHLKRTYTEVVNGVTVTKPWQGVVYHYFIARDASDPQNKAQIIKVNNDGDITWHTAGMLDGNITNNRATISICVDGYLHQDGLNIIDHPTEAQLKALDSLVTYLCNAYGIPRNMIFSHSDLRPTACCGNRLIPYVNELKKGELFKTLTKEEIEEIATNNTQRENVPAEEVQTLKDDPTIIDPPQPEEPKDVEFEETGYTEEETERLKQNLLAQDKEELVNNLISQTKEVARLIKANQSLFEKLFTNIRKLFRWLKTPRNIMSLVKYCLYGYGISNGTAKTVADGIDNVDWTMDLIPVAIGGIISIFQRIIAWIKAMKK